MLDIAGKPIEAGDIVVSIRPYNNGLTVGIVQKVNAAMPTILISKTHSQNINEIREAFHTNNLSGFEKINRYPMDIYIIEKS